MSSAQMILMDASTNAVRLFEAASADVTALGASRAGSRAIAARGTCMSSIDTGPRGGMPIDVRASGRVGGM